MTQRADGWHETHARFERRASQLRRNARILLATIYVLIGCGVAVFLLAPQITTRDFGSNLDEKLAANSAEIEHLSGEITDISQNVDSDAQNYKNQLSQFIMQWGPHPSTSADRSYPLRYDQWSVPSGTEIAKAVADVVDKARDNGFNVININFTFGNSSFSTTLDQKGWASLEEALKNASFKTREPFSQLQQLSSQERRDTVRLNFLYGVRSEINSERVKQAVQGAGQGEGMDNATWIRLVQTNVTRFGTLLMIGFLVGILIPLYKYNVRLSGYYLARSDALELMKTDLKKVGFSELVASLTPQVDFGRSPQTPIEQVIELLRATSSARHGES